jgi:hypothetical protein
MRTLRLVLHFSTDEANELTSPAARIYVVGKFPMDGDPFTYLSKDCASPSELDEAVDFLIEELRKIREEGHRKFAVERQKSQTQI